MKTLKKRKEKKVLKEFRTLKAKELMQIKGGDETIKDHDF
ncbi:MAG: ComC/BlpC family leader-containing pheromone/bacteriocin [Bacteroidales bacterium]|nr:ComC/BlpC family leader-containing pheromone/bacteriocin [Bacteroidales bacterium]